MEAGGGGIEGGAVDALRGENAIEILRGLVPAEREATAVHDAKLAMYPGGNGGANPIGGSGALSGAESSLSGILHEAPVVAGSSGSGYGGGVDRSSRQPWVLGRGAFGVVTMCSCPGSGHADVPASGVSSAGPPSGIATP